MDISTLNGRLSRRTFLRGTALGGVGLATAAVIGCDDDDDDDSVATPGGGTPTGGASPAPSTGTPEPQKTATLNYSGQNPIPTMSPNTTAASESEFHSIYDGLTRQLASAGGGSVEPGLAESWETADVGKTWVFKLRETEWSDGTPFTASDVKFSHDYFVNPDNTSALISRVGTYESSKVLDDRTIEITTKDGDPLLPLREAIVFALPEHVYTNASINPEEIQGSKPVGTGPYVATDYVQGQKVTFTENPTSYRPHNGFNRINFNWIGETSTRMSAFEAGDLDFATGVPTIDAARVAGFKNSLVVNAPATTNQAWDFANMPDKDPAITNDPRVRMALNYALDREGIIFAAYDDATVPAKDQLVPSSVFGHQPDFEAIPYDPDKARQLMADAGFASGADISIDAQILIAPYLKPTLEATIGLWDDIGVKSNVRTIEVNVWRDRLYGRATEGRPGAFLMGWSAFLYDASAQLQWHESTNPYGLWSNPRFDELFAAINREPDTEKRFGLWTELLQEERVDSGGALESGPSAFIAENPIVYAYRSDKIQKSSYVPWSTPAVRFEDILPA